MERNSDNEHRQGSQETDSSAHPAPSSGDQGATVPQGQAPTTGGQDGPSEGEGQGAEIVVGEIVGWRWWMVRSVFLPAFRLCSLCRPPVWKPGGVMEGNPACSRVHGVHAYLTANAAWLAACEWSGANYRPLGERVAVTGRWRASHVMGAIEVWGDVRVHKRGLRASHASIKSIAWAGEFGHYKQPYTMPTAEEWAAMYGVDYVPYKEHN